MKGLVLSLFGESNKQQINREEVEESTDQLRNGQFLSGCGFN